MSQTPSRKLPISATTMIMLSMVVGVIFGLVFPGDWPFLKMLGQVFLRLIQMSIILLVAGQIIEAIGGLQMRDLGKIGAKILVVFLVSSTIAAIWGIAWSAWLKPGSGVDIDSIHAGEAVTEAGSLSVLDTILGFFPVNAIGAMAQGNIMQVIIFALAFGMALSLVNSDGDMMLMNFIREFNKVIMQIVKLVMKTAPIGVFSLIASSIGAYGVDVVVPLAKYLVVFLISTLTFLAAYIVLVSVISRVNPMRVVHGISRMATMAVATGSSAITLPTAMADTEFRLGVPKKLTQIIMPLGVTLNSNGAAMHMVITLMTISQLYGVEFSFDRLIFMVVLCTFASVANAVVPGAGIVSMTIVVPQMGLPLESVALFAGVEIFVGMMRTINNVSGDALAAMLIAPSEGGIDRDILTGVKVMPDPMAETAA
ncbi:MAG: dicarboxylate/amino acid:cation symporter [Thermomicrobiales bacterium]|nr:dicarboxylate/amino acid:cation symporter [Thermomicrobiales bacterium]